MAIQYCFKYVGYPIIIASICLFCGFLFLLQSSFQTNVILGGMCSLIIIIALFIDLLLLPALLLLFGNKIDGISRTLSRVYIKKLFRTLNNSYQITNDEFHENNSRRWGGGLESV